MATSTSPPILHAAQIGVIPNELRSAAVFQPIAVHGLDTQGHHKRIWDLFTSNRRADRLPLHFYAIQADHRFPLAKAKAAGVEPSLSSGILRTNWVTKHCRDVPAVVVLFVELDWTSADWAERVEALRGQLAALRGSLDGRQTKIATVLIQSGAQQTVGM